MVEVMAKGEDWLATTALGVERAVEEPEALEAVTATARVAP
jgi:hypothetical protein